ncbi:endoglucanase 4-like [Ptychodera flava]|uniref:endoglucanase 4-like n=1 Tax=Ptychodera flava TaxID=63121 RepID=UPI00396A1751
MTSPADAYRWISVNCEEEHKYMCNFQCTKGYEKWCVHGDIIINDDGACTCQCWPGSYGDRCQEYDYNDVISKTILFFETQRSGRLPSDNRIPWRGDSALNDKGYNGEDLTGGWYDAGDHIKVTFKHTASVWKLALAFLEFGDAYKVAGQADYLYDTLIWGNNYTMKLHTKPNEFYVHVADPKLDHSYWGRPEDMTMDRPAYPSNETHPATEVAGNGVASLAASYLVFKDVNKPYADELLRHARELFNFADKFRGTCQENIPELEFKGGAYEDELTNAALWMYLATNETSYLDAAKEFYDGIKRKKTDALFTRNRLTIALQLMMYLTTKDEKYLKPFVDGLARWGPSKCMYTRKGLAMYTWNRPMKRAADISFIALIAAKHGIQSEDNFNFARSQIHYILGDGGRSYLTGFGRYPPLRPHHRGASCPDLPAPCGGKERNTANPSPQTLYGGLVGGPDERECYFDHRRNYEQNEAGINVVAFQGAVAGLSHFRMRRSNAT